MTFAIRTCEQILHVPLYAFQLNVWFWSSKSAFFRRGCRDSLSQSLYYIHFSTCRIVLISGNRFNTNISVHLFIRLQLRRHNQINQNPSSQADDNQIEQFTIRFRKIFFVKFNSIPLSSTKLVSQNMKMWRKKICPNFDFIQSNFHRLISIQHNRFGLLISWHKSVKLKEYHYIKSKLS